MEHFQHMSRKAKYFNQGIHSVWNTRKLPFSSKDEKSTNPSDSEFNEVLPSEQSRTIKNNVSTRGSI